MNIMLRQISVVYYIDGDGVYALPTMISYIDSTSPHPQNINTASAINIIKPEQEIGSIDIIKPA